jgi:hypothetical protein
MWHIALVRWLVTLAYVAGCAARTTPVAEPYWRLSFDRCEGGDDAACAEIYEEHRGLFPPAFWCSAPIVNESANRNSQQRIQRRRAGRSFRAESGWLTPTR